VTSPETKRDSEPRRETFMLGATEQYLVTRIQEY